MFSMIFNKGLSALCLMENNMFDSVYPITRAIIEIYIKMLVFIICPQAYEKYKELCNYDLTKGCKDEFPEEFNQLFVSRKKKQETARLGYLHFGCVDDIPDFEKRVKGKNYSIYALFDYLKSYYSEINDESVTTIANIEYLYDFCHTFTHGTTGNVGYPIAHYFNTVQMLGLTLEHTYMMLCEETQIDTKIMN